MIDLSTLYAPYWSRVAITLTVLTILGYTLHQSWSKHRNSTPLPPTVPGYPILGNALDLAENKLKSILMWRKTQGPIFYVHAMGQPIVVLNTLEAITGLLDHKSAIYSDRPPLMMSGEINGGGMLLPLLRYGDRWKRMRKATHADFGGSVASKYHDIQLEEAERFTRSLVQNGKDWHQNSLRSINTMLFRIAYGSPPPLDYASSEIPTIISSISEFIEPSSVGGRLADLIPALHKLPPWVAPWRRSGKEFYNRFRDMTMALYTDAALSDSDQPSFSRTLSTLEGVNMSEEERAILSTVPLTAGSDTTGASLQTFFMAMACSPDALRKAQVELDTVVGRSRRPEFSDMENLPYIRAIIKEVFRWGVIVPIILPHMNMEEDIYMGYRIPKGSIILANHWAVKRNPETYPKPDEFIPERFLPGSENEVKRHSKDEMFSFGHGRRICPGVSIANNGLFIMIATILWALDIKPGTRPDPNELTIDYGGLFARPLNFPCHFEWRDEDARKSLMG